MHGGVRALKILLASVFAVYLFVVLAMVVIGPLLMLRERRRRREIVPRGPA
jgi:hypothetical protein